MPRNVIKEGREKIAKNISVNKNFIKTDRMICVSFVVMRIRILGLELNHSFSWSVHVLICIVKLCERRHDDGMYTFMDGS